MTALTSGGEELAVLVHDPALLDEPGLVESVRATAGLVLENERLAAQVRSQLAEVRASRGRIVAAADAERRRIERNLHDGAQQRLVTLSIALGLEASRAGEDTAGALARAQDEIEQAITELRELARGIHPTLLRDEGLEAAVVSLARRTPLPVTVHGSVSTRVPDTVALAAYFVVAEALTNVVKHASAPEASVVLDQDDGNASGHRPRQWRRRRRHRARVGTCRASRPARRARCDAHDRQPGRGRHDRPRRLPMRVVIADDAPLIREGIATLLSEHGVDVVQQVADADALLASVRDMRPDVALIDIRMPPTHTDEGLRAAREIRARYPDVAVLVLSQHLEPEYALRLVEERPAGAGYLLKERVGRVEQLLDAIERVAAGECVVDRAVVDELLARPRRVDPIEELTPREREILALMAEGRSNQGICQALWLSPKTVETHIRGAFTKLGIREAPEDNRRVLAVLAFLQH